MKPEEIEIFLSSKNRSMGKKATTLPFRAMYFIRLYADLYLSYWISGSFKLS